VLNEPARFEASVLHLVANKILASQLRWPSDCSYEQDERQSGDRVNEALRNGTSHWEPRRILGWREEKSLGVDQKSDAYVNRWLMSMTWGKRTVIGTVKQLRRAGVVDRGEEKHDTSRKLKSEQDNHRHKGKHGLQGGRETGWQERKMSDTRSNQRPAKSANPGAAQRRGK
jgi:hypothetical protein